MLCVCRHCPSAMQYVCISYSAAPFAGHTIGARSIQSFTKQRPKHPRTIVKSILLMLMLVGTNLFFRCCCCCLFASSSFRDNSIQRRRIFSRCFVVVVVVGAWRFFARHRDMPHSFRTIVNIQFLLSSARLFFFHFYFGLSSDCGLKKSKQMRCDLTCY